MAKEIFKEDLDFQIGFYEGLLEKKPDFAQALVLLGEIYTRKGFIEKGLEADRKLVDLRPDDPVVHYNLACDYSLLKMPEQSLEALQTSLRLGYRDFSWLEKDEDLDFVRQDERFRKLVLRYTKNTTRLSRKTKKRV
jgi:tetratricopeptide (TPR) repeat protein